MPICDRESILSGCLRRSPDLVPVEMHVILETGSLAFGQAGMPRHPMSSARKGPAVVAGRGGSATDVVSLRAPRQHTPSASRRIHKTFARLLVFNCRRPSPPLSLARRSPLARRTLCSRRTTLPLFPSNHADFNTHIITRTRHTQSRCSITSSRTCR